MVLCQVSGNSNMTDMDKLLEEYLMPPPDSTPRSSLLRNSTESLRDGSSSSLDRSGHSSSTNASWNSSCSCHSMSALNRSAKSTFVFHKQSILPPLLCSSSRTEMKVYKRRAIEKEQKIKQKEKQRLISRVEAILSSVEISPAKNKRRSGKISNTADVATLSKKESNDVINSDHDDHDSEDELNRTYDYSSHSDIGDITIPHIGPEDDMTGCHDNSELKINDDDDVSCHSDDHSKEEEDGFHDNAAYRSSLRNLLQKSLSLNQSLGNSSLLGRSTIATDKKDHSKDVSNSSKSTSESEADLTENTVIDAKSKIAIIEEVKNAVKEDCTQNSLPRDLVEENEHPCMENAKNLVMGKSLPENGHLIPKLIQPYYKAETNLNSVENFTPMLPSDSEKQFDLTEEDTLVNSIVENVLEEAKIVLLQDNDDQLLQDNPLYDITNRKSFVENAETENMNIFPKNINSDDVSSWETPSVKKVKNEVIPLDISSSQLFELHNQSTSTKVDFPLGGSEEQGKEGINSNIQEIDQSPIPLTDAKFSTNEIIKLPAEICYDITNIEPCLVTKAMVEPVTMATTDTKSTPYVTSENFVNPDDVTMFTDDLTMLQPVMSDTVSDVTAQDQESFEADQETMKENCDPMETGTLLSIKRSFSDTPDKTSKEYESAVIEAVSQHFQALQKKADPLESFKDAEIAKKMREARVRRGSYNVEEPSPYLLKNKESLTIEQEDDVCSETTADTGNVKRKLDLPSDSEESSLVPPTSTTKQPENTGRVSRAELNVVNLCRILQDQHKQQMESMKRKHDEQLQSLQQELVKGKKNMSLPLDVAQPVMHQPFHDVTVSPSLASTEYKDIRIKDRFQENQKLPEIEYTRDVVKVDSNHDVSQYPTEADLSRISDIKVTPSLHDKFCKFSALCKGHLTRELLGSIKVQDILQIIRDTSRLILSLRLEENETKGMEPVRDAHLESRLFNQLRSALYNLHNIFFIISTAERMYIIAQSRAFTQSHALYKSTDKKMSRPRTLSTATQKSLERKKMLSTNSNPSQPPTIPQTRKSPKEVKSKISHIWKTDPVKLSAPKKCPSLTLPSKVSTQSKKNVTSQNKMKTSSTSQSKTMRPQSKPVTLQSRKVTSQSAKVPPKTSPVISQAKTKSPVKTQNKTSQSSKTASQFPVQGSKPTQRKTAPGRRPIPLMNRGNIRQNP